MIAEPPTSNTRAALGARFVELMQDDPTALGHADLRAWLVNANHVDSQFQALRNQALREFDRSQAYAGTGAFSSTNWSVWQLHQHPAAIKDQLVTGERLEHLADTARAFCEGEISFGHVRLIARTMEKVGYPEEGDAEQLLLEAARKLPPNQLRLVCRRLEALLAPDEFLEDANRQRDRRYLQLAETYDGCFHLQGLLDPEGGALMKTALDAAMGPRTQEDKRSGEQRRADALVDVIGQALDAGRLPRRGGERPHLCLTADVTALFGEPGHQSPTLDMTGEPVPVAMAQRLFCDCKITPVLLDEHGDVLRVGRSKRTFTAAQRKAIAQRDGGCAFPTCDRHPNWCDGHHLVPWYLGGKTEIENGALLCRKHHLLVHDDGWRLARDPATGLFDAVPP